MTYAARLVVAVAVVVGLAGPLRHAQAADCTGGTAVTGPLPAGNTTWTLAGSPWRVTGSVIVGTSSTLTIQAGVTVCIGATFRIRVDGTLVARGTAAQPILFTANQPAPCTRGFWNAIQFTGTSIDAVLDTTGNYVSGSVLEQVIVECGGGISIDSAAPFINHVISQQSAGLGLATNGADTIHVQNSRFLNNASGGVSVSAAGAVVQNIRSSDNGGGGIAVAGAGAVVQNVRSSDNGGVGIAVTGAGAVVKDAISQRNSGGGISLSGYPGSPLLSAAGNIALDNTATGMRLDYTDMVLGVSCRNTSSGTGGIQAQGVGSVKGSLVCDNRTDSGTAPSAIGDDACRIASSTVTRNVIRGNMSPADPTPPLSVCDFDNGGAVIMPCGGVLDDNVITANVGDGVHILFGIHGNDLHGNAGPAVVNNTGTDFDATGNWWGTSSSAAVRQLICDIEDDGTKGFVMSDPLITSRTMRAHASASTVDFGNILLGSTREMSLTVTNAGGPDDLALYGVVRDDIAYKVKRIDCAQPEATGCTLGANQAATVVVEFSPDAAGDFPATLFVLSNDPGQPAMEVALRGHGGPPPACGRLGLGMATSVPPPGEFCVDLILNNAAPSLSVRGVQATVVDVPDEFQLSRVLCTSRTSGFTCSGNEVAGNRINVVVTSLGGGCIAGGTDAIARVCLTDRLPQCPASSTVRLSIDPASVQVADCSNQPCDVSLSDGSVSCCGLLGDCQADNDFDLFDILYEIDVVLGRVTPTAEQRCRCDDTCDGAINIFDILREIDALLGRIPLPLTCPPRTSEPQAASASAAAPAPVGGVSLTRSGRVRLANGARAVRGLELTISPEGGPVEIKSARAGRRASGFTVQYHQPSPDEPAKLVVVSLDGQVITPGRGTVVKLRARRGAGRARLRLTDVRVAD